MGLVEYVKKAIIAGGMDKQKRANPFDIEYSDKHGLPEGADQFYNNSQYFSVHDLARRRTLLLRLAQRGGNYGDEVWFVYREGDGPVYLAEKDLFSPGEITPLSVECITAGKEIRLKYQGNLKPGRLGSKGYEPDPDAPAIQADLDLRFYGTVPAFEFSRHMATEPVARALSREKFTKEFQAALAENHQVHYEQLGYVTGTVTLESRNIDFDRIPAFRDHSYGKRDWNYMDRHNWFSGVLENGDYFQSSMVRYPAIRELQTGFYISREGNQEGQPICLKSQTSMDDLPLTGGALEAFSFSVEYLDGSTRKFECNLDFAMPFSHGGGLFVINEGVAEFRVNGIRGRGITEFGFNSNPERWKRG
jgi:hypothetical protein